jgi:2-alkenal reductase
VQLALVFAVALLAIIAARPYFERAFVVSPTPRSIEPRGSLSNIEGSTIGIFERVSPSVVQVAARTESVGPFAEDSNNGILGHWFYLGRRGPRRDQ